jgi:ABC-type antimicrobial peptide transport system permease subunit
MVRTRSAPRLVLPQLRTAVARVDPQLPLARLQTMEEVFDASIAPRRFGALLLAGFAGLAVMLALVGIYSVLSYEVAQRRREIGIRMALGSRRRDVLRMVVTEATALVLAGVAAGIVVSMLLSRFVAPLLYETRATDPLTYAVAGAVLATVALAAAWMPARRAAGGDPMVTMRVD